MNKSVMKCCICNNERIGEFITINNKKYHLCCIEQLQQENKQLKDKLKGVQEERDYLFNKQSIENKYLALENKELKEKIILLKASEPMLELEKYYGERDKYKEVIEEVREVIRDSHVEVLKYHDEPSETGSYEIVTVDLLQILDKVKGE